MNEAEQQGYIAESERTAKHVEDRINSATESDIDSILFVVNNNKSVIIFFDIKI